ncbi:hypothetical protein [Streptomyces sp. NPDC088400]
MAAKTARHAPSRRRSAPRFLPVERPLINHSWVGPQRAATPHGGALH